MSLIDAPLLLWTIITKLSFLSLFMVDGPSMEPTLHSGQVFMLSQMVYQVQAPARGDVVVFSFDDEPDYYYVKRVIGLPGEKLTVEGDGVYLHYEGGGTKKIDEPYLSGIPQQTGDDGQIISKYSGRQEFEDNSVWQKSAAKRLFVVPLDKYFVLGDNRAHSLDSRYFSDNYVPKAGVKGKYLFTLF
jgi:signal peptidase I